MAKLVMLQVRVLVGDRPLQQVHVGALRIGGGDRVQLVVEAGLRRVVRQAGDHRPDLGDPGDQRVAARADLPGPAALETGGCRGERGDLGGDAGRVGGARGTGRGCRRSRGCAAGSGRGRMGRARRGRRRTGAACVGYGSDRRRAAARQRRECPSSGVDPPVGPAQARHLTLVALDRGAQAGVGVAGGAQELAHHCHVERVVLPSPADRATDLPRGNRGRGGDGVLDPADDRADQPAGDGRAVDLAAQQHSHTAARRRRLARVVAERSRERPVAGEQQTRRGRAGRPPAG